MINKHRQGFTLMEVLIVLVVLAIIVSLAIPIYSQSGKKTYKAEAFNILNGLRNAQVRYYSMQTGSRSYSTSYTDIEFDPTVVAGTPHFTYSVAAGVGTFLATATGSTGVITGSTVTIDQAGAIGGNL